MLNRFLVQVNQNQIFRYGFTLLIILIVRLCWIPHGFLGELYYEEATIFFDQAYNSHWLKALFYPDYNYIPLFVRLPSLILVKALGVIDHFPFFFHIITFFLYSGCVSILVLNVFKFIIQSDAVRVMGALLFGIYPQVDFYFGFNASYGALFLILYVLAIVVQRDYELSNKGLWVLSLLAPFIVFSKGIYVFFIFSFIFLAGNIFFYRYNRNKFIISVLLIIFFLIHLIFILNKNYLQVAGDRSLNSFVQLFTNTITYFGFTAFLGIGGINFYKKLPYYTVYNIIGYLYLTLFFYSLYKHYNKKQIDLVLFLLALFVPVTISAVTMQGYYKYFEKSFIETDYKTLMFNRHFYILIVFSFLFWGNLLKKDYLKYLYILLCIITLFIADKRSKAINQLMSTEDIVLPWRDAQNYIGLNDFCIPLIISAPEGWVYSRNCRRLHDGYIKTEKNNDMFILESSKALKNEDFKVRAMIVSQNKTPMITYFNKDTQFIVLDENNKIISIADFISSNKSGKAAYFYFRSPVPSFNKFKIIDVKENWNKSLYNVELQLFGN